MRRDERRRDGIWEQDLPLSISLTLILTHPSRLSQINHPQAEEQTHLKPAYNQKGVF